LIASVAPRTKTISSSVAADKFGHPPPRSLIGQRHVRRARIDAAMDGGIILSTRAHHRIEHSLRLLRTRCGIEIMPVAHTGELVAQFARRPAAFIFPAAQCAFGDDRHQNVPRSAASA
jgi:hypothetical protein